MTEDFDELQAAVGSFVSERGWERYQTPKNLSMAIAVRAAGTVLLIERERGDYPGLWALPGGKVETDEHLHEAGTLQERFLLHLCRLQPHETTAVGGPEGRVDWFAPEDLDAVEMVPSDWAILQRVVLPERPGYYRCVVATDEDGVVLRSFEAV